MSSVPESDAATRFRGESVVDPPDQRLAEVLVECLSYAREHDYRGWDYGDGMSSRLRRAIPGEWTYLNIGVQELLKRAPVNLRPVFLVERRRNFKGIALFAMATQSTGWLSEHSPELFSDVPEQYLEPDDGFDRETADLLCWLLENRCRNYDGFCGTHQHRIQHLDGRIGDPSEADVVSTSYAVKALCRGVYLSPTCLDVARTSVTFLVDTLDYRLVDDGAVIDYYEAHANDVYTINAGALGARILLDLYDHSQDTELRVGAERLLDHIAGLQTDRGGWYYRDPPETSHLSMDSHHNGFIIECFQRHAEVTGSDRFAETLDGALSFYRRELFEADGAPNFDERKSYPRDIHAAAQGILVYTYEGDFEFARAIAEWTFEHLYRGDGQFYFRKHRFHTKRHVLMRWGVAWMAYALSEYLRVRYIE